MNRDLIAGAVLLAIAGAYYVSIGTIADSTLSDEVGAAGLPLALAGLLALIALVMMARAVLATRAARRAGGPVAAVEDDEEGDASVPRALGLLLIGAAYVVLLPYAGYVLSVALLIAAVAFYEGAARSWVIPAAAIGGAALYWAIFVKLLGVHQPAGILVQGWLS
ncbi:tripartite tricarboxylate transporter TctB family protein [Starkeya koreensis]|uniref:Tripartite tricarboxylate transporter TctB family protein n=1 Tax=Ancylobacter koreensis TaxID=266121 RepID=A0ABT0DH94_9HYPH|nr:tripartite tricarboxylate transporter TctB family protein [Ancylobacter koreensis]MCK0206641.1 tripartite tricarboxylate transporter TctB family protein [Ancylobacter koreensis]